MKRTASGILAALVAGGCTQPFEPSENEPVDVYGPPSMFGMQDEDIQEDHQESAENPDFNPADNDPECVYGPPSMFETEPDNTDPNVQYNPEDDSSFFPEDNLPAPVYGPPPADAEGTGNTGE